MNENFLTPSLALLKRIIFLVFKISDSPPVMLSKTVEHGNGNKPIVA